MDQSPLLANSFILSKLSTKIGVRNKEPGPDVETDTDHLTEYLSLGLPRPGLLLLPSSLQFLLPLPQPSNLTICLTITSLLILSPLLPFLLLLPTVTLLQHIFIPSNHSSEVADSDVPAEVVPVGGAVSDQAHVAVVWEAPLEDWLVKTFQTFNSE